MLEKEKRKTKEKETERKQDTQNIYLIIGRVIDRKTKVGVKGAMVEACDKRLSHIEPERVGKALTNEQGDFEIKFSLSRKPNLFFEIFYKDKLIKSTEDSVLPQVEPGEIKVDEIEVNVTPEEPTFKVGGHVLQADGRPVAAAIVKAFDKGLKAEVQLGETITTQVGSYEIAYSIEILKKMKKDKPDLVVRAYEKKDKELKEIAVSPTIFNANQKETIDLIYGNKEFKGPSEYKQLMDTLTPLLKDVELADLTEENITYLAKKTGIDPQQIVHLVLAAQLAKKTNLPPEVFYGLFRQNLPTSLPALLAQSSKIQQSALETAVRVNIIPEMMSPDQVLKRFQDLIVDYAFEAAPSGKASLSELLSTVQITPEQQREFVNLYVRHEGSIEDFWQGLENTDLQAFVPELQYTLQLAVLTQNHLPLIQKIKVLEPITCLRDLASLDIAYWKGLIETHGTPPDVPGEDEEEKTTNYAQTIVRMIQDAFPTAVIAHRVEEDEDIPGKADLVQFFDNITAFELEFEFGSTHIDNFLEENPNALNGVSDVEELRRQLQRMQRVFRVTPRYDRYDAMRVLLDNSLDSAQSITRMGRNNFVTEYSTKLGSYWKAKAIYTNAFQMSAMALTLFAKYSPWFNSVDLHALPGQPEIVEGVPDWRTLFGSLSLCECEHCRSVLSPSAYLVDILSFLQEYKLKYTLPEGAGNNIDSDTATALMSALEVLLQRRPDIGTLELSCENTDTPIPYIDLVNEVLENAVSPLAFRIELNNFQTELDEETISPELTQAFSNEGFSLSSGDDVSVEQAGYKWLITHPGWKYIAKKEANELAVSIVPQTYGTPDELSANPEHPNRGAYDTLAMEVYPWNLPFNLWAEEARTYLEHLGVPRCKLMETFQKNGENPEPDDPTIASEYLGLTPLERQIITDPLFSIALKFQKDLDNETISEGLRKEFKKNGILLSDNSTVSIIKKGNIWLISDQLIKAVGTYTIRKEQKKLNVYRVGRSPQEYWGMDGTDWIDKLSQVPTFLEKSGLHYKELLELLDTKFVNPTGNIEVTFTEDGKATCDIEKATITNLTEPALTKIHRFVRLWRKLDLNVRELDKIITALKVPDIEEPEINDTFLLQLSNLQRLRTDLKVPLINILSWWDRIDTGDRNGKTKSLYDQLFLNKAILNPEDEIFVLNTTRDELQAYADNPANPPKISEHASGVLAAFEISDADLSLLIGHEVPDILNLDDLSHLYRIVTFAKAMKLSIQKFLSAEKLTSLNPFDPPRPEVTRQFVEKVRKIRASGFTIPELDYLLRHIFKEEEGIAPTEEQIALILGEIRDGLQKIAAENVPVPDPSGELTSAKLAWLKWDESLIQNVIATLNSTVLYEVHLESLPKTDDKDIEFPDELRDRVHYNPDNNKLYFAGLMSEPEKTKLLDLSPDSAYQVAVNELFDKPKTFIAERMKAYQLPPFSATLEKLPPEVVIPDELKDRIYYDTDARAMFFIGWMTEPERDALVALMPEECPREDEEQCKNYDEERKLYVDTIDILFQAPGIYDPKTENPENEFLAEEDLSKLLNTPDIASRFDIILQKLLPYVRHAQSVNLVTQKLANALKLETKVTEQLLTHYVILSINSDSKETAIEIFLAESFAESNPNVKLSFSSFPEQFIAYVLLHKIALVIAKLRVTIDELPLLFQRCPDVWGDRGWADLNFLPLITWEDPPPLFSAMENLVDLFGFRDILLPGKPTLFEILNMAFNPETYTLDELLKALSDRTQWKLEDLQALIGSFSFALHDFRHVHALIKLKVCFEVIKRLGVSSEKICDWIKAPDASEEAFKKAYDNARSIKQAVKAKYDHEQWLVVAKPLQDVLREKQRSALVSYLVAHPYHFRPILKTWSRGPAVVELQMKLNAAGANPVLEIDGIFGKQTKLAVEAFQQVREIFPDGIVGPETWAALDDGKGKLRVANDLYALFLLDLEMSPCMMTSRIKLANSSVQLFIQRCLMNLEAWQIPTAGLALELNSRWKWMKNYRVWEANRKVFLYPENWIEPELRDNKSPFFEDLENELLQSDVTAETAEKAFLNYLEKLDAVSSLEICGMYHQEEHDGMGKVIVDILHVFGRTRGTPHIYYYRRLINSSYWTPWERVDLDIEGDHLIPVVWNRRLYLFWPIFTEKAEKGSEQGKEPQKYWEIQMAWSEYRNWKWSAKKVSNKMIDFSKILPALYLNFGFDWSPLLHLKRRFYFETRIESGDLIITCNIVTQFWGGGRVAIAAASFWIISCDGRSIVNYHTYIDDDGRDHFVYKEIYPPSGSYVDSMTFVESPGEHIFALSSDIVVLYETPGTYTILHPHQAPDLVSRAPFFYQDDTKTFFVTPTSGAQISVGVYNRPAYDLYNPGRPELEWHNPFQIRPEQVDRILPNYYDFIRVYEHWEEMMPPVEDIDPPIFDQTYPAETYYHVTADYGPDYRSGIFNSRAKSQARMFSKGKGSPLLRENASVTMTYYTLPMPTSEKRYLFETFYHPYVCEFIKHLNRDGIDGLLQRHIQMMKNHELLLFWVGLEFQSDLDNGTLSIEFENIFGSHDIQIWKPHYTVSVIEVGSRWLITNYTTPWGGTYTVKKEEGKLNIYQPFFDNEYQPHGNVVEKPYPYDDVDFEYDGSYSQYNWEVFFHAPLLIADRLSKNQRFEEAQKWFHYIFDPTDSSGYDVPQKFWKLRPFFESAEEGPPLTLFDLLTKEMEDLEKQVNQWRDNPFKPHLIARMRTTAYQKTVIMKYIDNLIAWADQLFRRYTIESINQATQLYILAAEILGIRPESIPPRGEMPVRTFNQLDVFSNPFVPLENSLPAPTVAIPMISAEMQAALALGPTLCLSFPKNEPNSNNNEQRLYFCIPKNDKLLSYWDTVADRLFKIRHCMTIEGIVRELPLFEPPIEPGLLVRAAAAGVDISSALSDLNAPLPHYRFQVMLQKATELCAEVRSLGASLLSALEKRDAEELTLLRSSHEVNLLKAVRQIKEQQVDEAKETLKGLKKALEATEIRYEYYKNIEKYSDAEITHLVLLGSAGVLQVAAQVCQAAAAIAYNTPDYIAGGAGMSSPVTTAKHGGSHTGTSLTAWANGLGAFSTLLSTTAHITGTMAGYERRFDEWKLQEDIAAKELEQIDKQIAAADIRLAIAEKDLENHKLQTENAKEVDTYMRDKFTNRELYNWMVSQISTIYFQSYQMAYDLAKRAEKAFQHELGDYNATFIKFGYWDSMKKGLLAGEKLHYDLKRMEAAYLDKNKREYEITKHISLAMLDPVALVKLKETGQCFVNLPEAIFDLDYPGQYMRRIKAVSLTIPCVTGPYTSVNCKLTLLGNRVRKDTSTDGGYEYKGMEDPRFQHNVGAVQSIATSGGQNDSGVFELNFRDERYLPFEGAGVISNWRIELPDQFRQFDYDTISDVIFHLNYTAREGGETLKNAAKTELEAAINGMNLADDRTGLINMFSARHNFPSEWHRFLNPAGTETTHVLELDLNEDRFPYMFRDMEITLNTAHFFLKLREGFQYDDAETLHFKLKNGDGSEFEGEFIKAGSPVNELPYSKPFENGNEGLGKWFIEVDQMDPETIEDILMVFQYSVSLLPG